MRKNSLTAWAIVLLAFGSFTLVAVTQVSVAQADDSGLFGRLDSNGDGFIEATEVDGKKLIIFNQLLRKADKNRDGKLSQDEFTAGTKKEQRPASSPATESGQRRQLPNPRDIIKRFDKNEDGKLSQDEAPDRMLENFNRIDSNKDGSVDVAELAQAFAHFAKQSDRPKQDRPKQDRPDSARGPQRDGPPREGPPRKGPPRGGPPPEFLAGAQLLRVIDRNHDGQLSADEIAAASRALAKLDRDQDGSISRRELMPQFGNRRPGEGRPKEARNSRPNQGRPNRQGNRRPEQSQGRPDFNPEQFVQRIMQADSNGDGKLSKEEAPQRMASRFDALDLNEDGLLDRQELLKMMARFRERAGQRSENRPRRPQRSGEEPEKKRDN